MGYHSTRVEQSCGKNVSQLMWSGCREGPGDNFTTFTVPLTHDSVTWEISGRAGWKWKWNVPMLPIALTHFALKPHSCLWFQWYISSIASRPSGSFLAGNQGLARPEYPRCHRQTEPIRIVKRVDPGQSSAVRRKSSKIGGKDIYRGYRNMVGVGKKCSWKQG